VTLFVKHRAQATPDFDGPYSGSEKRAREEFRNVAKPHDRAMVQPTLELSLSMKKLTLFGFMLIGMLGLGQSASASRQVDEPLTLPDGFTYESHGRDPIVRKVQLALEEDGYYVGDHSGQFGFETRWAVRRYRRDHGLPIVGKIDEQFLRTIGLR